MGYTIDVIKSRIFIDKSHFSDICNAIGNIPNRLSWTDKDTISRLCKENNITGLFEELMWLPNFENGNITSLEYDAPDKKIGDEELWMEAIAPFVESGSYIEIIGEDGDMWRWCFTDGKFSIIRPEITWEQTE